MTAPDMTTTPTPGVGGEEEVEDTIWPESPLATALFKHVQSEFSLHDDEAADVAGEIISILVRHGVDPTTLPPVTAKPADGGLREALALALEELTVTAETVRRLLHNTKERQAPSYREIGIPFVAAIERGKQVLRAHDAALAAGESA